MTSIVPAGERRAHAPEPLAQEFVLDFRTVLDSFTDAVVAADDSDSIVYLNCAAERLLGWKADELIGKPLWTIVPERLRPAHRARFDRFVETGEGRLSGRPIVLPALRKDESEKEVELTIGRIERDAGGPLMIGALRDVSERIELERHNVLARRLLKVTAGAPTLAEATPKILAAICEHLVWETGALWTLDRTESELVCEEFWQVPGADYAKFAEATRRMRFAKGVGLPGTVWEKRRPYWLSDMTRTGNFPRRPHALADGLNAGVAFPIEVDGRFLGVLEFFTADVRYPNVEFLGAMPAIGAELGRFIERRRQDDEAQLQRALLESQNENTLDGLLVVAPDNTILSYNRRFLEMWGIPDDVIDTRCDQIALQSVLDKLVDADGFLERVRYLYEHREERAREEILLKDGRIFDRYTAPLHVPDGTYVGRAWYTRDVTRERLAEQRLAESNMRYRHLAKTLQESLLPPTPIDIPGIEIATLYEPVGKGNVVGGDFYDFFRAGEGEWGIVVGDVCGKGVDAAAVTALVRYTIRAIAMRGSSARDVLLDTNAAMLLHGVGERFCTVAYAQLRLAADGYELSLATAGNPLPLLVRAGGNIETLGEAALPLGLFDDLEVRALQTKLRQGDILVLHTDGIIDSGGDRSALGTAGLSALLLETSPFGAGAMVERVGGLLSRLRVTDRRDDCALVALRALRPVTPVGSADST